MKFTARLETLLDKWLRQKVRFQLPPEGRKALAGALWWVALLVGIVQLWGAWVLWSVGHYIDAANEQYLSEVYGATTANVHLGLFYWLSFLAIGLVAVLMLLASPKLKQMKKSGWQLLFYAMLLNALFAVLRLLSGVDGVLSGFVGAVAGTLVGSYLLFQVREQFSGKRVRRAAAESHHED